MSLIHVENQLSWRDTVQIESDLKAQTGLD